MHGTGVDPLQVKLLHCRQRFLRFPLVEDGIELAIADGVNHFAMQLAQPLLHILIVGLKTLSSAPGP